ncbi:MAG TPA: ABC transporter permease [Aliiroseovarius sp.]|nr:ABC transporter permease [Aliiroseovarius sp.]
MSALATFAPLAWRNLWRNPRRTVITLIVVSIGLWSVLFFNSFLTAWGESRKEEVLGLLIGQAQIHAPGYLDNPSIETLMAPPDATLKAALADPRISAWAARLVLPGVVVSEYKTLPVMIGGVDPVAERRLSSLPGKVVQGRYLSAPDDPGVVIGQSLADRLNTGLGRRVILMSQNTDGAMSEQSFDVVGIFDADKETEDFRLFTGIATMRSFVGLTDGEISGITVAIPDEAALEPVVARLAEAAPDLDVRSWKKIALFLATTDAFMGNFLFIWLGVVFSLMAIGIVNTQLMAVFERTHEFGLLRALGMKPRQVLLLVALEGVLLIGAGTALGGALASATILALSGGIDLSRFAAGLEMFQSGQVIYPGFDPATMVEYALAIWALGVLVALWPARRAARLAPVEAMRRIT